MTALAETETAVSLPPPTAGSATRVTRARASSPRSRSRKAGSADWQKEFDAQVNKLRAPVERAIAHLKSWRILHTDYRLPLRTYVTAYRAAEDCTSLN